MSRPSTLPTKFSDDSRSCSNVSFVSSLPLPSSSPTDRSPTRGLSRPRMSRAYTWPMTANCKRCSAFGSTFAPASIRIVNLRRFGRTAAIAGRSTPGRTPMTNIAIAIAAPVLPAEMKAEALPSLTSSAATRKDESRLRRSACDGLSAIPTTCEAWRISRATLCASSRTTSRLIAERSPTRMTAAPNSRTAATAPSTTTRGP